MIRCWYDGWAVTEVIAHEAEYVLFMTADERYHMAPAAEIWIEVEE